LKIRKLRRSEWPLSVKPLTTRPPPSP